MACAVERNDSLIAFQEKDKLEAIGRIVAPRRRSLLDKRFPLLKQIAHRNDKAPTASSLVSETSCKPSSSTKAPKHSTAESPFVAAAFQPVLSQAKVISSLVKVLPAVF